MSAEILTINLGNSETEHFNIQGRYFEILSSTYTVDIEIYGESGEIDRFKGCESGFFSQKRFLSFVVKSLSTQTVKLLVTDGTAGTRRQPGNVSIIDNSVSETRAGLRFLGTTARDVSVGSRPGCYVMSDVGASTAFTNISMSSATAGPVAIFTFTGDPTNTHSGPFANVRSLQADAGFAAYTKTGNALSSMWPPQAGEFPGYSYFTTYILQANVQTKIDLKWPLVLPAGMRLGFVHSQLGADLYVNFHSSRV